MVRGCRLKFLALGYNRRVATSRRLRGAAAPGQARQVGQSRRAGQLVLADRPAIADGSPATAGGSAQRHRPLSAAPRKRSQAPRKAQKLSSRRGGLTERFGPASHGAGWCWDGIACEAGARLRSPHEQDRIEAIPSTYTEKHAAPRHRPSQPELPAGGTGIRTAERPGGNPRAVRVTSASEWIRSPCRRRRRARRGRGSSPASPRSRPRS